MPVPGGYSRDIRSMLRIAIPLALAELGWMAMGLVDTIMVGRLPASAISIGAASVGNALFYVFAIFGIGLMSGLDTLVSHALERTTGRAPGGHWRRGWDWLCTSRPCWPCVSSARHRSLL